MRVVLWIVAFLVVTGMTGVVAPPPALAQTCACLDNDGDDNCGPGDTLVDNNDWLLGPFAPLPNARGQFPGKTFVLPAGCDLTKDTAPKGGIVVDAQRIVWRGRLTSTPSGGEGVLLRTTQTVPVPPVPDIVFFPGAFISSGGINHLPDNADNAGVAKASIGLKSEGRCILVGSTPVSPVTLLGNPITGSGQIGMHCHQDIEIHGTVMRAGGIDIQSIQGAIDASCGGGGLCEVGDCISFPCVRTFNSCEEVQAFCTSPAGCNSLFAHNNPLNLIAYADLRLDSSSASARNQVEGHYRIKLYSETGRVDQDNAFVTNYDSTTGQVLGNARISEVAHPASIKRWPVFKEEATGPCTDVIEIDGACYRSPNKINYCGTLVGTPDPNPVCAQIGDFVLVNSDK